MSRIGQDKRMSNYKIILLGDTGVGKTSIITKYIHNTYDEKEQPTIGIDFLSKNISYRGDRCRLQLWDSAGQERYMSLVPNYLRDVDCILFVFDANNKASLAGLEKWISIYVNSCNRRCVTVICGNKNDLQKQIDKDKLKELMERYKMPYHSLSAKTGESIQELFSLVLDMLHIFYKNILRAISKEMIQDAETLASERGIVIGKIQETEKPQKTKNCSC